MSALVARPTIEVVSAEEHEARELVRVFVVRQRDDVTMRIPTPGDFVVFNWTTHRRLARGGSWAEVARGLGLGSAGAQ